MTTTTAVEFETIIGLEVHAQLLTRSKMYCGCSADYAAAEPNTHTCPVCLGLPGALPVINRAAIDACVLTGIALGCAIPGFSKLDRKNYVYPDLPKGYQISQYDLPLCTGGLLEFESGGRTVGAGITRVHIEEDTGRLVHRLGDHGEEISLVDLNRSGVPLMEIVGDPDLRSPEQARDYLVALRQILRAIGASTGNMEEGAFRCDANVSVRSLDGSIVGAKVEIKNMNSFRSVERALHYEEVRQRELFASGGATVQETRGWSDAKGVTTSQRTKERAHDYRYFPEPDLPPMLIPEEHRQRLAAALPELPAARRDRYVAELALGRSEAALLTGDVALSRFFEAAIPADGSPSTARATANWLLNDVLGLQGERGLSSDVFPITPSQLTQLVSAVEAAEMTPGAAKQLLPRLEWAEDVLTAARRFDLIALDDDDVVRTAIVETIAALPEAVADFQRGKSAAIGRLIGETIRRTGGRAKPDVVRRLLLEALGSA